MRPVRGRRMIHRVGTGAPPIVISLALERGADPISGELECEGRVRPFTGWLELARALEEERGRPGPVADA